MKYRYELSIREIEVYQAKQILNLFYAWLIYKLNYDYKIIEEKDYIYLLEPFNKTKNNINYYRNQYKENNIYMQVKQTEELNQYLEHTKRKYKMINSIPEHKKSIQHYNRLLSWYSKTPNNVDMVVKTLIESSLNNGFENIKKSIEISNDLMIQGDKLNNQSRNNKYKAEINLKGDI